MDVSVLGGRAVGLHGGDGTMRHTAMTEEEERHPRTACHPQEPDLSRGINGAIPKAPPSGQKKNLVLGNFIPYAITRQASANLNLYTPPASYLPTHEPSRSEQVPTSLQTYPKVFCRLTTRPNPAATFFRSNLRAASSTTKARWTSGRCASSLLRRSLNW